MLKASASTQQLRELTCLLSEPTRDKEENGAQSMEDDTEVNEVTRKDEEKKDDRKGDGKGEEMEDNDDEDEVHPGLLATIEEENQAPPPVQVCMSPTPVMAILPHFGPIPLCPVPCMITMKMKGIPGKNRNCKLGQVPLIREPEGYNKSKFGWVRKRTSHSPIIPTGLQLDFQWIFWTSAGLLLYFTLLQESCRTPACPLDFRWTSNGLLPDLP
ncbi:hypothetical protein DFP72DRAFT_842362 [Ephemerocybe angulata]|uniref:Uncharacterized protein n=1 Tax=Ephemerocybe angulata TaxID=980116 RepID=A0A8H6IC05_9AGAR|nr:hypothetical protein DFP72DRAFT_842362 [Tulosesus angulatus]